jgi:hypothetical protein
LAHRRALRGGYQALRPVAPPSSAHGDCGTGVRQLVEPAGASERASGREECGAGIDCAGNALTWVAGMGETYGRETNQTSRGDHRVREAQRKAGVASRRRHLVGVPAIHARIRLRARCPAEPELRRSTCVIRGSLQEPPVGIDRPGRLFCFLHVGELWKQAGFQSRAARVRFLPPMLLSTLTSGELQN